MRIITLFVCFICLFISLLASNPDSLKNALSQAEEHLQAELLNQLATALLKSQPDAALAYARQAEKISLKHNQIEQTSTAKKLQGNYHYNRKEYSQAMQHYQAALPYASETANDKLVADLHNNLGQAYTHTQNPKKALEHLQKSLALRKKLPSREDETSSLINLGNVYWNTQNYARAAQFYEAATALLDKSNNPKQAAIIYNNLGNAYSKNGEPVKALNAYIRSLRLKEAIGTPLELAAANANIGNLYYLTRDYANAVVFYKAAQKLYQDNGEPAKAAQITGNLGAAYNELKAYDQAIQQHQKALEEFRKKGMQTDIAKTLNNLGNVYKEQKNFQQAIACYEESIEIKKSFADNEGLAISYFNLGEIALNQENLDSALKHTQKSLESINKINSRTMLRSAYQQLATIYEAKNDYPNAFKNLSNFVKLDHELYYTQDRNMLTEMMVRFETEEKAREISQLKTEQQAQKRKLAEHLRDKVRLLVIIFCILIFSLVMGFLYQQKQREAKKRKAVQTELETLNAELETRVAQAIDKYHIQQQIITQKSKLEALGKLSAGIAHEINQPLSALSMSLDNIQMTQQMGKLQPDYFAQKLETMQDDITRIRQIIEHVRQFSRDHKDERIEQVDVNATLLSSLSLLQTALEKQEINIIRQFSMDKLCTVGNHFKLEQVFVNLISNARDAMEAKQEQGFYNGKPKTLVLKTELQGDQICIKIEDNGCGIDTEMQNNIFEPFYTTKSPDMGTGLGLSISYGIISEMQGTINVESKPNQFTRMTILLPYIRSNDESA